MGTNGNDLELDRERGAAQGRVVDADVLSRLDDEAAYEGKVNRLRVGRVLRTLTKHLDTSRAAILVQLTGDQVSLEKELRIDLLIRACAALRPSPPEVVQFWDAHCHPADGFSNVTIASLVDNGSIPALQLFVTKLLDPAHDQEGKLEWLRQDVLPTARTWNSFAWRARCWRAACRLRWIWRWSRFSSITARRSGIGRPH